MANNTNELRTVIIHNWDHEVKVLDLTDREIRLVQWCIDEFSSDVYMEKVDEMERVEF